MLGHHRSPPDSAFTRTYRALADALWLTVPRLMVFDSLSTTLFQFVASSDVRMVYV